MVQIIKKVESLWYITCTCTRTLIVDKIAFHCVDIHYTVFSTCVRTSAKHKLDFPQNNIHDTDFYTCTRQNLCTNLAVQASSYNIAFYAYTHTSVMHKIVFSSVEIPYTVLCASSGTSEERKIEVHSVDRHYKHSTAKANQACKCKH